MTDDPTTARRRIRRAQKDRAEARSTALSADCPIHDAVRPCLTGVTYLARRDPLPPLDVVYEHARSLLSHAKVRLDGLSLEPADTQDVYYALVAYIDEVLQSEPGPLKEFWQAHLLQLLHFGETRAGEGFFHRLERASSDGRLLVVRVYYVCLLLGFRGIYHAHGDLERENLIVRVRETLLRHDGLSGAATLAPHGARPHEPGTDRTRNWLLQSVAAAAMTLAALWYVGLVFVVDARAESLRSVLRSAYEDLTTGRVGADSWEGQ
jgi:type VI secretion system protein ImpK